MVKWNLWWQIVGIIEAVWEATLGPSFPFELYRFRCWCDSDLWTRPCFYRVRQVAGGVCIALAAHPLISPHPFYTSVELPMDLANGLGVNLTWGFHTQTIVRALLSSVSPGTRSQVAACHKQFIKTLLPLWFFFKMRSHEKGFVSTYTVIPYSDSSIIYCFMIVFVIKTVELWELEII
jgi:hypothetical protein